MRRGLPTPYMYGLYARVPAESGRKALKTERIEVIDTLSSHLVERFQKVLDDWCGERSAAWSQRLSPRTAVF